MLLQRHTISIRPLTTAHLAQTMSLLELNTAELRQKIEQALAANPALELVEEMRCPTCGRRLRSAQACPICCNPARASTEQPLIYVSQRSDFYSSHKSAGSTQSENTETNDELGEDWNAAEVSLAEYVLQQIANELTPAERPVAAHLLTSLDEDGLLTVEPVEIARLCRVPLRTVEHVQRLIQHADPPGVGSSTPQAAMLAQLEILSETQTVPEQAFKAVKLGLKLISLRHYHELAAQLGVDAETAKTIAEYLKRNLYPFPGRAHWGEARHGQQRSLEHNVYYTPDVIISTLHNRPDSPLIVEIAAPIQGTLRMNPLFQQSAPEAPQGKGTDWQADLTQAALLIKCLQQRSHTLVRILEKVTVLQRSFILHGDEYLLPLTRAWLAENLELHESTISRAVADKAIQLPNRRIIPFARFFDRSLSVRTVIRQMIEQETQPLSDSAISQTLTAQGYEVARRTVAKYRAMEGILPAHIRRLEKAEQIALECAHRL